MRMLTCLLALLCSLAAITVQAQSPKRSTTAPAATQPVWENAALIYKGQPVHPMAMYEFAGHLSSSPVFFQLDLDGALSTNRYPQKVKRLPDGSVYCQQDDADEDKGYVDYHVLGRLKGGTYVLMFSQNGGGSGVFEDLLFVRPVLQTIQGADGKRISRSMLQLVDSHSVGDRYGGRLQVLADRVIVGPYGENIKQEVVLHEPRITEP